jgi:hypothetical protein
MPGGKQEFRSAVASASRAVENKSFWRHSKKYMAGISFPVSDHRSCQVGAIDLEAFVRISLGIESIDFKRMAHNYLGRWNLVQWRSSNCTVQERLALALLELSEAFGIRDNDGLRLSLFASHRVLAELVGASRPRVTEHLSQFEQDRLIARKDRQLIVQRELIETFLSRASAALNGGESA